MFKATNVDNEVNKLVVNHHYLCHIDKSDEHFVYVAILWCHYYCRVRNECSRQQH